MMTTRAGGGGISKSGYLVGQIGYSARNLQDYKNSYPTFYIYGAEAINNQMVIVG